MKPDLRKYIDYSHENSNAVIRKIGERERKFNATGFRGFTDDAGFFNADGDPNAAAAAMATSEPYILTVSNASAASVANFDIWFAAQYLNTGQFSWSNGSLTVLGVTISAAVNNSNVTYYTMLQQSMTQPFEIGKTQIVVLSGPNGQINNGYSLVTTDMSGKEAKKFLPFVISPGQFQSGTLVCNMPYRIDGSTFLRTTIMPSAVFQLYFWPSANINLSRSIGGDTISKQFSKPVDYSQEIKLIN